MRRPQPEMTGRSGDGYSLTGREVNELTYALRRIGNVLTPLTPVNVDLCKDIVKLFERNTQTKEYPSKGSIFDLRFHHEINAVPLLN